MQVPIHHPELHRFTLSYEGHEAVLIYTFINQTGVDFCSTYVPPAARGKGIAEALVRAGLAWAKAEELEITASCWYVAKFLR